MGTDKQILCIDFDDVIVKTKQFIEPILEKTRFDASARNLMIITARYNSKDIDQETKELLERAHYDAKDRVLEEVDEEYKGLINYDEIIRAENTYLNAIEYVNYLYRCGRYDEVYIFTLYNTESERVAKEKFINRYWPGLKMIAVPFHVDKYEVGKKRPITSKAEYFMKYRGLDNLRNVSLIDDSIRNGGDWIKHGGRYIQYNPELKKNVTQKVTDNLFPYDIMVMSQNDELKLGRGR